MTTGKRPQAGDKVRLDSGALEKAKARSFAALFLQNMQKLSWADADFLTPAFSSPPVPP